MLLQRADVSTDDLQDWDLLCNTKAEIHSPSVLCTKELSIDRLPLRRDDTARGSIIEFCKSLILFRTQNRDARALPRERAIADSNSFFVQSCVLQSRRLRRAQICSAYASGG